MQIEIHVDHKNGQNISRHQFSNLPLKIGNSLECDIALKGWGIQAEHCQIHRQQNQLRLSTHAKAQCLVNEDPAQNSHILESGDRLKIGKFWLEIHYTVALSQSPQSSQQVPLPGTNNNQPTETNQQAVVYHPVNVRSSEQDRQHKERQHQWHVRVHKELLSTIDLRRIQIDDMDDQRLRAEVTELINQIVSQLVGIDKSVDINQLKRDVINEAIGLGPLEDLLEREDVTEIMVNAPDAIFYESEGKLHKSEISFSNAQAVMAAIERIVLPLGRRIDESSPMVDARLADGSRVNAIIPPLALKGPCLTIRKFSKERLTINDLVSFGALNSPMAEFLQIIVQSKQNLIISGGTGSGKTTLLNVLSSFIPDNERIITIEDAAELQLHQPNLVSLESKPANQEGKGLVPIRDLVKNSLRMRPDRIIIGECRGAEALDMLQAMNTGHDGSLSTAHANSPRDCLSRLEVMVLMAGMDLPLAAIREQSASAINFVVQQTRFPCGSRKITAISEIGGLEQGTILLTDIFKFQQQGYDLQGKIQGQFLATGIIPDFIDRQRQQGMPTDTRLFQVAEEA